MTLGEGKRKVLMLLDEYSTDGIADTDRDLAARMNDFFDLAQKNVAGYQKIVREFVPGTERALPGMGTELICPPPEDFAALYLVWRDGRPTDRYGWRGNNIVIPAADVGRVRVGYFAVPKTIPADAGDDYEFQVSEGAAACMPYFVAAQQVMADLIMDPAPFMEMYDRMAAGLPSGLPGTAGGVKQRLYG